MTATSQVVGPRGTSAAAACLAAAGGQRCSRQSGTRRGSDGMPFLTVRAAAGLEKICRKSRRTCRARWREVRRCARRTGWEG